MRFGYNGTISDKGSHVQTRYLQLDVMRGSAILLMIAFHLCFDLNHFGFIAIDIYHAPFWRHFRYLIVSLFLLCVGISLYLANHKRIDWQKNLRRLALLAVASAAISVSSYLTFPNSWIYFGILHFIAVASLLGLLFIRIPHIALVLGIVIIAGWNLGILHMHWLYDPLAVALHLPYRTEDLAPLTPWFGVVLIGIFAASRGYHRFALRPFAWLQPIASLGRHSLLIYLVHQPLLFGALYLLHRVSTAS